MIKKEVNIDHLLLEVLGQIGFPGSVSELIKKFNGYHEIILKWNQRMNLVSNGDREFLVSKHFIPSIGLVRSIRFPKGARVMDLGSGAGFPGIPLKLIRQDIDMVLVESTRKKALFLRRVIKTLDLNLIEVLQERVETLKGQILPVDMVVSRAVSDLKTLVDWSRNVIQSNGGQLIALKGRDVHREVEVLEREKKQFKIKSIEVREFNSFPMLVPMEHCYIVVVDLYPNNYLL